MCLATSNNLLLVLWDTPKRIFFTKSRSSGQLQKKTQRHFFPALHPLSPIICATATVLAFVLLRNSRFNFHFYTQREATPTQKSAGKWRCDLSWLLARKITKGIHSCEAASLNRPIGPSDILFAGVYVCTFRPGNFTGWGSEAVNAVSGNPFIKSGRSMTKDHVLQPSNGFLFLFFKPTLPKVFLEGSFLSRVSTQKGTESIKNII